MTGADLHSIVFKDAVTGVIVGDNGVIFRTDNGGASWAMVNSTTGSQASHGVKTYRTRVQF